MSHPVRQPRPHDSLPSLNCELPYAQFVNLDVEIADGILVTVLRKDPTNIGNPLVPMIHGGVVGALLEHAALMQLCHELNLGLAERPKIINLSIDYLRPCLLADTFAQGTIVRRGRRVANVRVEAWQSNRDRWVAAAHAHFLLRGD